MGASGFLNHLSGEAIGHPRRDPAACRCCGPGCTLWRRSRGRTTSCWTPPGALSWSWRSSLAVEWAMRRAVRRPILALVRRAPNGGAPVHEEAEARAERGEDRAAPPASAGGADPAAAHAADARPLRSGTAAGPRPSWPPAICSPPPRSAAGTRPASCCSRSSTPTRSAPPSSASRGLCSRPGSRACAC